MTAEPGSPASYVDLHWLPLGAGERLPIVRWNGRAFEAWTAWRAHRTRQDIYHAALEVDLDGIGYVIELAPAAGGGRLDRGVVCEGPVGTRWLGRSRLFRYEVRRWRLGTIPDLAYAVGAPARLTEDRAVVERLLDLVPRFPTATWGRDELGTGDMWNSNSLISWLLAGSGVDLNRVSLPVGGRAPGWAAGLSVAATSASAAIAAISASSHEGSKVPTSEP